MKPTIYFDMDGVLADFVGGALAIHGCTTLPITQVRWEFPVQLGFAGVNDPAFWARMGLEFWLNLRPCLDGFSLLRWIEGRIGAENIGLISSPCDTPGCRDGKWQWVKKHLPEYEGRLFLGREKHFLATPCKVLVDDHDKNIDLFEAAGGRTLQIPRPWNRYRVECLDDGSFDVGDMVEQLEFVLDRIASTAARDGQRGSVEDLYHIGEVS